MTLNWDMIGAIAEMLGGVAVVVSLIFVADQTDNRRNIIASTEITRCEISDGTRKFKLRLILWDLNQLR